MSKKSKNKIPVDFLLKGNLVVTNPEHNWVVVGRPTLARRLLGYPFGNWDIVGFRKVKR